MPAPATTCRVTVVGPDARIDVSLPNDVALNDLLPSVISLCRADTPTGGWTLGRFGQPAFDGAQTLADVGVRPGEVLQLRHGGTDPPPVAYSEPAEAVAAAVSSRRRWSFTDTGPLATVVLAVAVAVMSLALLRIPADRSVRPAVVTAALLLGGAVLLARRATEAAVLTTLLVGSWLTSTVATARLSGAEDVGTTGAVAAATVLTGAAVTALLLPWSRAAAMAATAGAGPLLAATVAGSAAGWTAAGCLAVLIAALPAIEYGMVAVLIRGFVVPVASAQRAGRAATGSLEWPATTESAVPARTGLMDRQRLARVQVRCTATRVGTTTVLAGASAALPLIDGRIWSWLLSTTALLACLLRSRDLIWWTDTLAALAPTAVALAVVAVSATVTTAAGPVCVLAAGAVLLVLVAERTVRGHSPGAATTGSSSASGASGASALRSPGAAAARWTVRLQIALSCLPVPLALAVLDLYTTIRHG